MRQILPQAPARVREAVIAAVEARRDILLATSREIHAHPELSFNEHRAVALLTSLLQKEGFTLESPLAGLETAFRGSIGTHNGPTLAFLAEYDALAGLGHGCGHNLMGTASVGAALALASTLRQDNQEIPGRLEVVGTPAEEGGGGKIILVQRGVFKSTSAALIFHPSHKTVVRRGSLTAQEITIEFHGKEAHAALAPDEGINALDAMLLTFASVNALRQQLRSDARIHGIITEGGKAPNVIPAFTSGRFMVRAADLPYARELLERFRHCAEAAARATGARLVFTLDPHVYDPMVGNDILASLFAANLAYLGVPVEEPSPDERMGSTDMGNVSQVVPALHPYLQISDLPVTIHTAEFREAANSPRGEESMLNAAKALALTGADLFLVPANLSLVKELFSRQQEVGLVRGGGDTTP